MRHTCSTPLIHIGIDSPSDFSFEQGDLAGGSWFLLALTAGNLEGKSVEKFKQLEGPMLAKENEDKLWQMADDHKAGDLQWDPLGFKPKDASALKTMQTKEINNGRLAMIGIAGMVAQELVTHMKI